MDVRSSVRLYTSTNAGVTWIPRGGDRDWWRVATSADGTQLVGVVVLGVGTSSGEGEDSANGLAKRI